MLRFFLSFTLVLTFLMSSVSQNLTLSVNDGGFLNNDESLPDVAAYVNPMIGTKKMGHTFPGAVVPFGMVQLSPETNKVQMYHEDGSYNPEVYRYCSGYQYDDTLIYGFAHTHFSGTGHADLGDLLLMPVTGSLSNSRFGDLRSEKGFSAHFRHENELAVPGFYQVFLHDMKVSAALTTTERVGFHRYRFPEQDSAHLVLDLMSNIYGYEGKNVWTFLRVENDSTITGYKQTTGWARTRTVYFAIRFSRKLKAWGRHRADTLPYKGFYRKFDEERNFPEMAGKEIRAFFSFMPSTEELNVKVALSAVSTEGALLNMETEVPHWDFELVKQQARAKWNAELNKIHVKMMDEDDLVTFYTALYHSFISPIVFEDADGSYRGLDQNIHQSDGFTNYSVFSLWDTYRALHPLFNLVQAGRNNDMIHSMLAHYDQSVHKMLPIWSHYANENWCMIGYHAVSVLADAVVKNTTDAALSRIVEACVNTSNVDYFDGIGAYRQFGYVPEDKSANSVSKTLEYAYNDWCISQLTNRLGSDSLSRFYTQFSEAFHQVYDPAIGYMRPRMSDGSWRPDFDPYDTHGQGFIEGSALNYGLYVPHQAAVMVDMMGGKQKFSRHLDMIFSAPIEEKYIAKNEDITRDGIIGNYVHGNEPGHHIAYLYHYAGHSFKTQERVRMIMESMYDNEEDGLCGNDDAGQMSAWYVFNALGFYPFLPGSDLYEIGSPLVKEARIHLSNNNFLNVKVMNQSSENVYIEKVLLNGNEIKGHQLRHDDLVKGGELQFFMRSKHL